MFKKIEWIEDPAIDELIDALNKLKRLRNSEIRNDDGQFVKAQKQLVPFLGNALVSLIDELAFGDRESVRNFDMRNNIVNALITRLIDASDPEAVLERRLAELRDNAEYKQSLSEGEKKEVYTFLKRLKDGGITDSEIDVLIGL
jgi:hemerythrin superfamily protein